MERAGYRLGRVDPVTTPADEEMSNERCLSNKEAMQ